MVVLRIILLNRFKYQPQTVTSPELQSLVIENSKEFARRCVEAPLKPKPNQPKFQPCPSLLPAARLPNRKCRRYPVEKMSDLQAGLFPRTRSWQHTTRRSRLTWSGSTADTPTTDCLILSWKHRHSRTGRSVQAVGIEYHESGKFTPELAEARWASEQAKARELQTWWSLSGLHRL